MSDKPTVIEALSAVMAEVQPIGKDQRNTEQGYNFRGIDAVVNAVGPIMRKHGVVPMPIKASSNYRDVLTSRGKPSRECTVNVTYRFYGPAGDHVDAEVPGESMDFGDKGTAKAMSVAFRILLLQTLIIPTDDPDPDSDSYERASGIAEPVTDHELLKRAEDAITAADSMERLEEIKEKIRATYLSGKLEQVHSDHLLALWQKRGGELQTASNGAGAAS